MSIRYKAHAVRLKQLSAVALLAPSYILKFHAALISLVEIYNWVVARAMAVSYSGKLSREKTFMNFMILQPPAKNSPF